MGDENANPCQDSKNGNKVHQVREDYLAVVRDV
jgi:hypothetical protein